MALDDAVAAVTRLSLADVAEFPFDFDFVVVVREIAVAFSIFLAVGRVIALAVGGRTFKSDMIYD